MILDHNGNPWMPAEFEDGIAIPHILTFTAEIGAGRAKYHQLFDEALRHSREDAMAMRRDAALIAPYLERRRAVSNMKWHLEVPDERDPIQQAVKEGMTTILRAIPRFKRIVKALFEATWYGKFGVQLVWKWKTMALPSLKAAAQQKANENAPPEQKALPEVFGQPNPEPIAQQYAFGNGQPKPDTGNGQPVNGQSPPAQEKQPAPKVEKDPRRVLTVRRHTPVNGDKFGHLKDRTPYVLINFAQADRLPGTDLCVTTVGGRGLVLRGAWAERFIIHIYDEEDADFFDPERAEAIEGIGLRHQLFWWDWIKKEWLGKLTDFIDRVGLGVNLWKYDASNPASLTELKKAAAASSDKINLFIPVWKDGKGNTQTGLERLEIPVQGANLLIELQKFVYEIQERLIIGQTSSSRSNTSGMGTHDTTPQQDTKQAILQDDAENLAETLTGNELETGLVNTILKWSYPEVDFPVMFVFDIEKTDPKEKLEAVTAAAQIGVHFKENEVRALTGLADPQPGDDTVGGKETMEGGDKPGGGGKPPDGLPGAEKPGESAMPTGGRFAEQNGQANGKADKHALVPFGRNDSLARYGVVDPSGHEHDALGLFTGPGTDQPNLKLPESFDDRYASWEKRQESRDTAREELDRVGMGEEDRKGIADSEKVVEDPDSAAEHLHSWQSYYAENFGILKNAGANQKELGTLDKALVRAAEKVGKRMDAYSSHLPTVQKAQDDLDALEEPAELTAEDYPPEPEGDAEHDQWEKTIEQIDKDWSEEFDDWEKKHTKAEAALEVAQGKSDDLQASFLESVNEIYDGKLADLLDETVELVRERLDKEEEGDAEPEDDEPDKAQRQLQPALYAEEGSHWITLGGHAEDDKKHVGGTPALIDGSGKILAGPQWAKDAGITHVGGGKVVAKEKKEKEKSQSNPESGRPDSSAESGKAKDPKQEAEKAIHGGNFATHAEKRQAMEKVKAIADKNGLSANELWRDVVYQPEGMEEDIEAALAEPESEPRPGTPRGEEAFQRHKQIGEAEESERRRKYPTPSERGTNMNDKWFHGGQPRKMFGKGKGRFGKSMEPQDTAAPAKAEHPSRSAAGIASKGHEAITEAKRAPLLTPEEDAEQRRIGKEKAEEIGARQEKEREERKKAAPPIAPGVLLEGGPVKSTRAMYDSMAEGAGPHGGYDALVAKVDAHLAQLGKLTKGELDRVWSEGFNGKQKFSSKTALLQAIKRKIIDRAGAADRAHAGREGEPERYITDPAGREHAPAGSPEGGQFTAGHAEAGYHALYESAVDPDLPDSKIKSVMDRLSELSKSEIAAIAKKVGVEGGSKAAMIAALRTRVERHKENANRIDFASGEPERYNVIDPTGREHDKLGLFTGPGGDGSHAAPVHGEEFKPGVLSRVRHVLGSVGRLPGRMAKKVKTTFANRFEAMEKRYGRKAAIAVMSASVALLPVPMFGTFYIPMAIAEGVRWVAKLFRKGPVKSWREELAEMYGKKDAAGHEHAAKGSPEGGQFVAQGGEGDIEEGKKPVRSEFTTQGDLDANRPSRPENRHKGAKPEAKPWRDPPPKKGKKGQPAERLKGEASQTALGDHAEELARQLGFRNILPEGKRTAAGTEDKRGSIDLEFDHSARAYELKMCRSSATEYRLKAKGPEKEAKLRYAKKYKLTPYTLIGVRDVDTNEIHFYGSKEPGFTGAEVNSEAFEFFGTVKF